MTLDSISRRKLLASLTAGGAAALGGLAAFTSGSRAFPNSQRLQTGTIDGVLLDWRETYNGRTLTESGRASTTPSGPAISLGNVLPGDSGSLSVRLRLETESADAPSDLAVEPELTFALTSDLSTPGLHEYVHAAIWYDTGLFGVGPLGADNAERDIGEGLVHPDASGTLGEVAAALEDGVVLDAAPNAPLTSCLDGSGAVTVTFGWSFPLNQPDINAVQGDTIEFDLSFNAIQC